LIVREVTELITPGPARALAGLLGVPGPDEELPLLWHWVYLLDRPPQDALGPDGHRARGGMPDPPGPGLRRMFAGGRVWRHGALRVGRSGPSIRTGWSRRCTRTRAWSYRLRLRGKRSMFPAVTPAAASRRRGCSGKPRSFVSFGRQGNQN